MGVMLPIAPFHKYAVKMVRYADDFDLMGENLPDEYVLRRLTVRASDEICRIAVCWKTARTV